MRKLFLPALLILISGAPAWAQSARRVVSQAALPAACIAGSGASSINDVVILNTGAGQGLYYCQTGGAAGTWLPVGGIGATGTLNYGTVLVQNYNADATTVFGTQPGVTGTKTATAATLHHSADIQLGANTIGVTHSNLKTRSTATDSNTILVTGDDLAVFNFWGADGVDYINTARILVETSGTLAATRVPSQIVISTSTDAAPSVLTTAIIISNSQVVQFANGANAAPSITFASDLDTGISRGGADILALQAGGTRTVLDSSAYRMCAACTFGWSSVADPTGTAADTLLSRSSAGAVNLTATGTFAALLWQATLFANLGAPANGHVAFCSDCTIANPCAGAGTGAIAKRLNGVWVCN